MDLVRARQHGRGVVGLGRQPRRGRTPTAIRQCPDLLSIERNRLGLHGRVDDTLERVSLDGPSMQQPRCRQLLGIGYKQSFRTGKDD
jgi:hypothetical protein